MRTIKIIVALLVGALASLGVKSTYAHAFGEKYDLPIPLNFFLIGGAATVALSFVVIGLFVRRGSETWSYPRYNLMGTRWLGAVISSPVVLTAIKVLSVAFFGLVLATSFFGTNNRLDVLSPTFVWIIWWVGTGYIAALFGNLWMLVNPWKITFEWAEKLLGSGSDGQENPMFRYPEKWDVWPAILLFLAFAWLENVYNGASVPFQLGMLILLYSVITWGGMLAFGKHTWLRHGEAFSVLFGFFARFSPTEVRVIDNRVCGSCERECNPSGNDCVDCYECFERAERSQREFNVRPYAVGLAHPGRVSTATAAFVVLALATVTFDGFQETSAWKDIQIAVYSFSPTVEDTVDTLELADLPNIFKDTSNTLGLILVPSIFMVVYLGFSWAIRKLSGEQAPVFDVAKAFVFSLVPIALAYNMAHFLSLLLITGQSVIPLLSDPFGYGWDIIGTADYRVNIRVLNVKYAWYIASGAIVLGHIISVYIAHVISMRRVSNHSLALRGQYPMLALMVIYTFTSLWIIAQPLAEG